MKSFKQYLIPSLIASLFMSTYAIIDGIFIGYNLNDIGLAAINIAWPITAILQSIGFAMGISAGIYLSRLDAQGKIDIKNKMRLTILIYISITALIIGSLLFIFRNQLLILFKASGTTLDYANNYITIILYGSIFQVLGAAIIPLNKNLGHIKLSMIASLSSTLVNFVMDFLFIVVFKLGLEGAAIASLLGAFSCFIIGFIPYILECRGIYFSKEGFKEIFLGFFAPFILNYSYSVLIIITNALCMKYGNEEAVASYTVLSYLLYVINALASGSAEAIQPLFSYTMETKDYKRCFRLLINTISISFILVSLFIGIFLILKENIARLYGLSDLAIDIYNNAFTYYIIGFIFISLSKVICAYLYSINKKIIANIFVLLEPLVLTPLFYLLFIKMFNLTGLWIAFMVVQIILSISLTLLMIHFWRNKNGRLFDNQQTKGAN